MSPLPVQIWNFYTKRYDIFGFIMYASVHTATKQKEKKDLCSNNRMEKGFKKKTSHLPAIPLYCFCLSITPTQQRKLS